MKQYRLLSFLFAALALLFSSYLMFHTFSYDTARYEIRIASKLWSDFGAHIPLVRSFSYGANFARLLQRQPIESPLYPGQPIRYHFGFYAIVGILEKLGLRIDWALNIPSTLGFFALLVLIFLFSYKLFSHYSVSILSVLFLLFNGSLSFTEFFKKNTFTDIITNSKFPSFGPWDGSSITAFWTLNIYTNQRHLGLSYALILFVLLLLVKRTGHPLRTGILLGLSVAVLSFINFAAAAIAALFCAWTFIADQKSRLPLIISFGIVFPAYLVLLGYTTGIANSFWQPGYLVREPFSIVSFVLFWWQNLGLHTILIPLGFFLVPKVLRVRFGPPLLTLFILPNLFRFSADMINNHKFFNFFLIIGNMFSAYAVIRILKLCSNVKMKLLRMPLQIIVGMGLIGALTLSGIIDFFPIINDTKGSIPDIVVNPDAQYIALHTKPADIIANSTWFYHPGSVAGRSIFSGYTYFTWSYGYDQQTREVSLKSIYAASDEQSLCRALKDHNISLVELNRQPESYLIPNWALWNSLTPVYENPETKLRMYTTKNLCYDNAL